jgi:hypothetical protein
MNTITPSWLGSCGQRKASMLVPSTGTTNGADTPESADEH